MNAGLPWYAELLGQRQGAAGLERLVQEYGLVEERSGTTTFLENERRGISVVFAGDEVSGIHHLSDEIEGCTRFADPLPLGLAFSYTRDDVARMLGPPDHDTAQAGGVWRYELGTCWVAVAFSRRTGRIESVTLESPTAAAKVIRAVDETAAPTD